MSTARYAAPARGIHWITVALVGVIIVLGLWIAYFRPEEEAFKLRLSIITLIGAHVAGVIYHTFIRKDGLLQRML